MLYTRISNPNIFVHVLPLTDLLKLTETDIHRYYFSLEDLFIAKNKISIINVL